MTMKHVERGLALTADRGRGKVVAARMLAALIGSVFVFAAATKAVQPRGAIEAFDYLFSPGRLPIDIPSLVAVRWLVLYELVLGSMLLFGVAIRASLWLSFGTFLVFAGWVSYLVVTGATIGCGCGVVVPEPAVVAERWWALGRLGLLLGATSLALRWWLPLSGSHGSVDCGRSGRAVV